MHNEDTTMECVSLSLRNEDTTRECLSLFKGERQWYVSLRDSVDLWAVTFECPSLAEMLDGDWTFAWRGVLIGRSPCQSKPLGSELAC